MPRRAVVLGVALAIVLGCQDSATTVAPEVAETDLVSFDAQPIREILVDPLVQGLIGDLSDRGTAQTFEYVIDALQNPPSQRQLAEIDWTFDQLIGDLAPRDGGSEDEIERGVLELIIEDARLVLDGLDQEKGN